jgi:hypothetical protein
MFNNSGVRNARSELEKEMGPTERATGSLGLRRAVTLGPTHCLHLSPPPSFNLSTRREAVLEMCFLWNKR